MLPRLLSLMRHVTTTTSRAYDVERRRLMRQRTIVASLLGIVLVPLFGVVDYFLNRPDFVSGFT